MKNKIQFFLIAVFTFLVINAQAQSVVPVSLGNLPIYVTNSATSNLVSTPYLAHGYLQYGLGLGQPYTIWISSTNSATNLNTNVYVFTYTYDGTTNTPANTNGGFTGATFSITDITQGNNVTNRHYYYFAGTNLNGIGGFYLSAITNMNTNGATVPLSVVVQTSQ